MAVVIIEVLWVLPEIVGVSQAVGVLEQVSVTLRCFMVALSHPFFVCVQHHNHMVNVNIDSSL